MQFRYSGPQMAHNPRVAKRTRGLTGRATPATSQTTMTAQRAASLPPGEYVVPGNKGLYLLVRPTRGDCSRTWLFRYTWGEKRTRMVLGALPSMSLAQAHNEASKHRQNVSMGIDPRRAIKRRPTAMERLPELAPGTHRHSMESLATVFLERHIKRERNRKRPEYVERILRRYVLTEWAGRDARSITSHEVLDLLDKVVDRGSPVMANRLAAVLVQLFKYGIHRKIIEATPVQLLFRPGGKELPRVRTLSDAELRILLSVEPHRRWARMHHAINVLLLTGQRRGELALANWNEFNFDKALWAIPGARTKTGKATLVPLSPSVIEELRDLRRLSGSSPWLFPNGEEKPADPKLLTRNVARAQERFGELGIAQFTLHDLRRTCRTGLSKLKIPPHIAERVMNHAPERIVGTYDTHDYLDEKRDALVKWSEYLKGLCDIRQIAADSSAA